MSKKIFFVTTLSLVFPFFAHADVQNLQDLVKDLVSFVNSLVPLLLGAALVAFMWGVIKYIWNSNPQKLKEAREYMIFSIVGFAVMLSVWGLALLLKNTFFPNAGYPIKGDPTSHGVDYYPTQNPNLPLPGGPTSPIDPSINPTANA